MAHLVAHTALCIVEVGVGGIERNVMADGQTYTALHLRGVGHALQPAEEQRVVGNDEIQPLAGGLFDDRFGHVKTQ